MSFNGVPGATNGKTSSSGLIGMSITVVTSLLRPALIAFSNDILLEWIYENCPFDNELNE